VSNYVIRRLLLAVPTILGVSLIIFAIMRFIPGDAVDIMIQDNPQFWTPQFLADVRESMGLDKPIHHQYLIWIGNALKGDFGLSYWQRRPVVGMLKDRFPRSIELAVLAGTMAFTIGVSVGILSAIKQDTWIDYVVRVWSIGGLSLPSFFTATVLIYAMLRVFHWIPPLEYVPLWENPMENLAQFIWPALILSYGASAPIARMTRSQVLEVIRQDYIRTARSKGLAEKMVIWRHTLKNALLPVVTIGGIQVGHLLGGVVILERIFVIPGMGTGILDAVQWRDYPAISAFVLVLALIFVAANLIVDLLYGWLDPRIRYD